MKYGVDVLSIKVGKKSDVKVKAIPNPNHIFTEDETLIESLEIARDRILIMIDKGMDNEPQVLQGLIDKANKRIAEIESGEKPPLTPDANAKYYAEFVELNKRNLINGSELHLGREYIIPYAEDSFKKTAIQVQTNKSQ
mgnify:CR=1 FL=1